MAATKCVYETLIRQGFFVSALNTFMLLSYISDEPTAAFHQAMTDLGFKFIVYEPPRLHKSVNVRSYGRLTLDLPYDEAASIDDIADRTGVAILRCAWWRAGQDRHYKLF